MSGEKTFFRGRRKGSKSDLINMVKYNKAKKKANKKKKFTIMSPRGPF